MTSAEPLWRAIAVYRFASIGYAVLLLVINQADYSRPGWAWVVIALMTAWTAVTTVAYAHPERRTRLLLSADLAVTAGLLLSTAALQYPAAMKHGVMPVTAIWVAGPVLAWAVRYGRRAGAIAALVISGCDFLLRSEAITVVLNGVVLLLLAGVVVGHLARLAAEVETERRHVLEVEAASRERERLARDIHDSVLQVLAMVQRRGAEAGGEAAELGRLAARQEAARDRLGHVYWIGGGSGAGKSTIARRLADRHGLRLYATDEAMADHGRRIVPADSPFLAGFAAMDMDERWVSRSPETMLETFHWFRGEGFGLIVDDLLRMPGGEGVIAEGFRLLPHLVQPLLAGPGHAVWLCPTPGFRRAAFASRGSLREIAGRTSDPERALRNLLERDRMFTERLREEAAGLGLRVIDVDVTMTEDDLARRVARAFGL